MDSNLSDMGSPRRAVPTTSHFTPAAQEFSTFSKAKPPMHCALAAPPPHWDRGKGQAATPSKRMVALRTAWAAHTVKRALAAVGSASDEDYRAFGWDRGDLLAKLRWLRAVTERPHADGRIPTAITLALSAQPARCAIGI